MIYKLINKTKISDKTLKKLIEFGIPKGLQDIKIYVLYEKYKNSIFNGATIYKNKTVQICITKKTITFPCFCYDKKLKFAGYHPTVDFKNKKELLVGLLSHELRHLWQDGVSKQNFLNGRVITWKHWDKKTYYSIYKSERDACKYSKKMVLKYRKYNN